MRCSIGLDIPIPWLVVVMSSDESGCGIAGVYSRHAWPWSYDLQTLASLQCRDGARRVRGGGGVSFVFLFVWFS